MKPKEIQELLEFIAQSGLEEVQIETESLKLSTKKYSAVSVGTPQAVTPVIQAAVEPVQIAAKPEAKPEVVVTSAESNYITIKSPMIGTFYRTPGPNEDPFVNIGDAINVGSTVCIIEAMKLFNEIEAEFGGKIVKILAQDKTPVEYDQPLFLVDPS